MKWLMCFTTELFIFCQLLGWTHTSWWWMAYFLTVDSGMGMLLKKEAKLDRER